MRDRVGEFFREKTPRRLLAFVAFAAIIYLFRQLFVLLIFFVAFERALGGASSVVVRRFGWSKKLALLSVVGAIVATLGLAGGLSARRTAHALAHARDTLPERMAAFHKNALVLEVREHLPGIEKVIDSAGNYAGDALHALSAVGHIVVYALIGLILAVVFLLEKEEVVRWQESVDSRSLVGTLTRWFGHVADAITVTVQLQIIVAACNTALTLPLLIWLGIPHKIALMALIFLSGLVPVIGNIVSGTVLSLLAFQERGWLGVGLFVALTFVLHKLEAYYLNPRLTMRHVKLPGFLLVVSLLAWEHLLGFAGLFVSFPFLFIAGRIRSEIKAEDAAEVMAARIAEEIAIESLGAGPESDDGA